jgi:HSP20 family molecular chaperone IbpA
VEEIAAKSADGILEIHCPKEVGVEKKSKKRTIEIK